MLGQHLAAWLQKIRRNSHLFGKVIYRYKIALGECVEEIHEWVWVWEYGV